MVGMSTGQRVSYLVSGDLASKSDWAFNVWFAIKNQRGIWKNLGSEICSPQTISKACSQLSCLLRKRVYDVDRQTIKMSRMFRLNAKLKKKMYHTLSVLRYNWITPGFHNSISELFTALHIGLYLKLIITILRKSDLSVSSGTVLLGSSLSKSDGHRLLHRFLCWALISSSKLAPILTNNLASNISAILFWYIRIEAYRGVILVKHTEKGCHQLEISRIICYLCCTSCKSFIFYCWLRHSTLKIQMKMSYQTTKFLSLPVKFRQQINTCS